MTGKTHRVGGMLCVLGGFSILESKGMLLTNVNPVLQLVVMYPFAIYGSIFPDLDHGRHSIPSEDIVSVAVNRVLHAGSVIPGNDKEGSIASILNAKHRSWQTHSDLFLALILWCMYEVLTSGRIGSSEYTILLLVGMGFLFGVVSHLVLDMLTPEGVWLVTTTVLKKVTRCKKLIPQKISFVPNTSFFRTDGMWERVVRRVLWLICSLLFIRILYLMSPYRVIINL